MKPEDLEALERLCPEAEPYEVYLTHHRDIPHFDMLPESFAAIAACIVRLGRENQTLKREKSKTFKEGYNRGLDAAKKVLGYEPGRKERG